ncbi:MAG: molybdopterin-dependent oxidoreductase [Actinomycetia bacterium]|nr:molybdopterin-dependent oxidoreductase [Actinomycetes bacterium]
MTTTDERTEVVGAGVIPAGLAGALAAGAALSIGELAAALAAPRPGPVVAVANRVLDNAPSWFVDFGKAVFGLADKPALVMGTAIISVLVAIGLGVASRRNLMPGIVGISVFGLIGLLAIGVDSQGGWAAAVPVSLAAIFAGVGALIILMGKARSLRATGHRTVVTVVAEGDVPGEGDGARRPTFPIDSPVDPAVSRRSFLNAAGAIGATAAVATVGASVLRSRSSVNDARDAVQLDSALTATELETRISDAASSDVAITSGISPLIVDNDDFYLIDTAILTPQVDPAKWELTIKGMVDNEVVYTYEELLDRANLVEPVTLSCVSNEIGGTLVGNAIWQGVALTELLDEAGVDPAATQIASRSVDGWSCGFPTEVAFDGRTSMVAIAMNDEPLPLRHGFPARLVVSGLYGYVSATKWLSEIELTTMEDFDGYWIPRGWSKLGPVKTQSRIDTPRQGTSVRAGAEIPIAGVAWAPHRGIERVEIQIDDGPWLEADLGESLGENAWCQWRRAWTTTPGRHLIRVRATDGTGETQTPDLASPAPSGATGWHEISVTVT